MQILNMESGLRQTMVIVFRRKGLSQAEAEAKADRHLKAACGVFTAKCREATKPTLDLPNSLASPGLQRRPGTKRKEFTPRGPAIFEHARRAVVAWAHSLP